MIFSYKKTENCFADSQTYEYQLPVTGEELLEMLGDWQIRRNMKLRRPVGICEKNGTVIKTVLAGYTARVSFPESRWEKEKELFERWLAQNG